MQPRQRRLQFGQTLGEIQDAEELIVSHERRRQIDHAFVEAGAVANLLVHSPDERTADLGAVELALQLFGPILAVEVDAAVGHQQRHADAASLLHEATRACKLTAVGRHFGTEVSIEKICLRRQFGARRAQPGVFDLLERQPTDAEHRNERHSGEGGKESPQQASLGHGYSLNR